MIHVLFAHPKGPYYSIPNLDVWDEQRNALNFTGTGVVIAHPPCRLFCRLSHFSTALAAEKELAYFAVRKVRQNGGVLEHPYLSKLWQEMNLPLWPQVDEFGGWTLTVDQFWWGHKARKRTWLYIVGCAFKQLPRLPLVLGESEYTVSTSRRKGYKAEMIKSHRSLTPPDFASWLLSLATVIQENRNFESTERQLLTT